MPDETLETLIPKPAAPESLAGKTVLGSLIGRTLAGPPAAGAFGEATPSALASGIELGDTIGEGGMGRIYRARQAALKRDVAVKMVREEYGDNPVVLQRFIAESVVTGALEHPNIVPVHDLARTADRLRPYLAMKLVDGREWAEILEAREPGEWLSDARLEEQLEILHAVGNAVAFAHSRGVVHRDLKPQNIMVGAFGEVLVMDWGLALDISETPSEDSLLEHRSTVRGPAGTPAFMAPELATGHGNAIGPWTDVYLLGGILHEIITGYPPHRGGSIAEVLLKASQASPPQFGPEVPHELVSICTRALAAAPEDRYPDVAALQEALKGFLKHRESERLCDAAEARLTSGAGSAPGGRTGLGGFDTRYARLAEAVAGYRQAQVLWPQSKRAVRGEASARIAYAEDALARDDLGLAEAQLDATRAPGLALAGLGARSDELRERVTARRGEKARARRNAKLAGAGALVLLVATIVSLALGRYLVGKERDRVAEQKTIAEREAKEANRQKGIADGERAIAQEQRRVAVA
ncbi:MAG: serine/threonine-protein kinase, partial [Planctomycetota bacterium]